MSKENGSRAIIIKTCIQQVARKINFESPTVVIPVFCFNPYLEHTCSG